MLTTRPAFTIRNRSSRYSVGVRVDESTVPLNLVRVLVEFEPGDAQPRTGSARPGALQHRSDAAEQLLQAEGLGYVVVSADSEPIDAIGYLVARGQEDHRNLGAPGTNPAERLEPVAVRQHHVKQDQIRPGRRGGAHRRGAARRRHHLEPRQTQRSRQ